MNTPSAAQDSAARHAGESHFPLRASRSLRRAVADTHGRPAVLSGV